MFKDTIQKLPGLVEKASVSPDLSSRLIATRALRDSLTQLAENPLEVPEELRAIVGPALADYASWKELPEESKPYIAVAGKIIEAINKN